MELKAIQDCIQPTLLKHQLILVETKWVQEGSMRILQIAIMDQNGEMDIETCAKISAEISPLLDETSLKDQTYYLEVCSPGAERELKDDEDIIRSIEGNVLIRLHHPIEKSLEWEGKLLSYDGVKGSLEVQIKARKKTIEFTKENLAKIRLAVKL
jgi:ribosome maturation factor RimP